MKTLYILRHAKSSWDFNELSDHDRPLNKRGRTDAAIMGQELASRDVNPEIIISSTAVRALSTATLISKELGFNPQDILLRERVYGASKEDLLEVVQEVATEVQTVMLVGHNETISEFANSLSPEPLAAMPTAGVIALEFNCDSWYEISRDNARLLFFDFPKNYE
ncbi:SixA phosphatase family protein [Pontibacter arcticus]|uniref:Histidine phosphatase family protein n=1 Tax=Pontibacter arcticus TaxID=2080288 RepID=A0A364RIC1_9BACT|nr:histidine phosphatase family protein [Pontibacter arcticus]RAU84025.1 histidine phosphatase family protein [Pontibacter arcticus]